MLKKLINQLQLHTGIFFNKYHSLKNDKLIV